jgi:ribosomal protein S18 acetylase RimI-like enzyme
MGISSRIARLATYYKRHGFRATAQRAALALRRAQFLNRQVIFYCDLANQASTYEALPGFLKVERKESYSELSPQDLREMVIFWNPKLAQRNIEERLGKGASLWLIKFEGRLAGYGWTLRGRTIAPHYFPLGRDDFHLFDFHVFPQYRGRGVNPLLVDHILHRLEAECLSRAFIEVAEWNSPQLSSLQKTRFCFLGQVRKITVLGRTIVCWDHREGRHDRQKDQHIAPIASSRSERLGFANRLRGLGTKS